MASELPDEIDCRQFNGSAGAVAGTVEGARLGRLASAYRVCEPVQVALRLHRDEHARWVIAGTLTATLEGRCQRCLEAMRFEVATEVSVIALVAPDDRRSDDDEWSLAPGGRLGLIELIEDELLLACPMIDLHDERACDAAEGRDEAASEERQLPFAGLADLLKQR